MAACSLEEGDFYFSLLTFHFSLKNRSPYGLKIIRKLRLKIIHRSS